MWNKKFLSIFVPIMFLLINQNKMNLGINRPVQNVSTPVAKASNIDSMKFLESMTQIYEKNGRSDLAQGLKAGMLKAKANS